MSLNESIVEEATLLLPWKLGVRDVISVESFGHRVSGFKRLYSGCGPGWGRKMCKSHETISVL